jgi:hypothetical protein
MIMPDALPGGKRFFKPLGLSERVLALTIRCVAAFALHWGRMSAVQAAGAVRSEPRHRAQVIRFLGRRYWRKLALTTALQAELLRAEATGGRFVLILDQTLCSQQGTKTENTYSTGNRRRRPRKGRRYNPYKHARKRCHCFVVGLLITPGGVRVPFRRSYYTKDYCGQTGRSYRKQTELAAEIVRDLPLPDGADVVVLGDTAFDAEVIRAACGARQYPWVVPMNPERVLAGAKPRPKVRSLAEGLTAERLKPVRLRPGHGRYAALRRLSAGRSGPQRKPRTYYVHSEGRAVHSVGEVRLVFSTREHPTPGRRPAVQKILMTNDPDLTAAEVVELYDLRWQIELFFKELKGTLGFDQYRFRRFDKVEAWLELVLVTFLYLEWHRARQLRRAGLSAEDRDRWRRQRTHGACVALRQATERADLDYIAAALQTPGGIRRLRRRLRRATPKEYRVAA